MTSPFVYQPIHVPIHSLTCPSANYTPAHPLTHLYTYIPIHSRLSAYFPPILSLPCSSVHPSIYLCIQPLMHPPTRPSVHLSLFIYSRICSTIYPSIHPSTYISTHPLSTAHHLYTHPSNYIFTHPSSHSPITYLFHPHICPSNGPFTQPSIHPSTYLVARMPATTPPATNPIHLFICLSIHSSMNEPQ